MKLVLLGIVGEWGFEIVLAGRVISEMNMIDLIKRSMPYSAYFSIFLISFSSIAANTPLKASRILTKIENTSQNQQGNNHLSNKNKNSIKPSVKTITGKISYIRLSRNNRLCREIMSYKCDVFFIKIRKINGKYIAVDRYDDNGDRISEWSKEAIFYSNDHYVKMTFDLNEHGEYILRNSKLED